MGKIGGMKISNSRHECVGSGWIRFGNILLPAVQGVGLGLDTRDEEQLVDVASHIGLCTCRRGVFFSSMKRNFINTRKYYGN